MTTVTLTGAEEAAWDLSDLYAGPDDPALNADLDAADTEAGALDAAYRGLVAGLSAPGLAALLGRYEALREQAAKAAAFAALNWTQNTEDPARGALLQRITERSSKLGQKLVWLELELAHAPDDVAAQWIAAPELGRYDHWLEIVRLYRPYLLSEPEEKILAEKSVTGRSAWDRFFDETHSAARYELDGEEMSADRILS
jgi:oligoendopeptidase F